MDGEGIFLRSRRFIKQEYVFDDDLKIVETTDDIGSKISSFPTYTALTEYVNANDLTNYNQIKTITVDSNYHEENSDCYFTTLRRSLRNDLNKNVVKLSKMNGPIGDYESRSGSPSPYMSHETSMEIQTECGQSHCKYGCICDTLHNCDAVSRDHCGHYECIFGCVCDQRKLLKQKSRESDSSSNEGLRRSKRRKCLSIRGHSYFENTNNTKESTKKSPTETAKETKPNNKKVIGSKKGKSKLKIKLPLSGKNKPKNNDLSSTIKVDDHESRDGNFDYLEISSKKDLKKPIVKTKTDVHKTRSEFYKRLQKSLKQTNKPKQTESRQEERLKEPNYFKESTIIEIENSLDDGQNILPLYIEAYIPKSQWMLRSKEILKQIAFVFVKLTSDQLTKWQQIQFDCESLTVRLLAPHVLEKYAKNNDSDETDAIFDYHKPIGVKVLKLNEEDKLNYLNKLKNSLVHLPICPSLQDSLDTNSVRDMFHVFIKDDLQPSKVQDSNKYEIKQRPRLLRKKHSFSTKTNFTVVNDATIRVDDLSVISTKIKAFQSAFANESLILPLYSQYGRANTDDVCETVYNMVRGICLYDEHLKNEERKRFEEDEKKLKFFNFTKNILSHTNEKKQQIMQVQRGQSNLTNICSTTKRITPILPKLPPCIKVLPSAEQQQQSSQKVFSVINKSHVTVPLKLNSTSWPIKIPSNTLYNHQQQHIGDSSKSKTFVKLISVNENQNEANCKKIIQISSKVINTVSPANDDDSLKPKTIFVSSGYSLQSINGSKASSILLGPNKRFLGQTAPNTSSFQANSVFQPRKISPAFSQSIYTVKKNDNMITKRPMSDIYSVTSCKQADSLPSEGTQVKIKQNTPMLHPQNKSNQNEHEDSTVIKTEPINQDTNIIRNESKTLCSELIEMRKRKRKQEFSQLLHKCIANARNEQKQNSDMNSNASLESSRVLEKPIIKHVKSEPIQRDLRNNPM